MGEWKEYLLGDLGVFSGGVTSIKPDDYGFGTPFLPYTNVYRNSKVDVGQLQLMNVNANDLVRKNCLYGDIFFTAASETDDEVAMSSVLLDNVENLTFNGFSKRYRLYDFQTLLPEYARYYFRSHAFRREVFQRVNGDIRYNISQASLKEIPIVIPAIDEQRAIASVLSSLDAKIDLLHRQNKTLEAMAETLFRQWFVEEAEEGWEEMRLDQFCSVGIGRTPPRKEQHWFSTDSTDVKWISIKDMAAEGPFIFNTAEYLTEEAVERFRVPLIPEDTVVLSFKMTLGRVKITTDVMLSNEAIAHFRINPDSHVTKEFLYLGLKTYQYETLGSTSTIVDSINSGMIKEMVLQIPPEPLMDRFMEQCGPWFKKVRSNQLQISTLTALRDTLLPKLMSGEVRLEQQHD